MEERRHKERQRARDNDDASKKGEGGGRQVGPALFSLVARSRSRAYATPITRSICLMHSVKLHQSSSSFFPDNKEPPTELSSPAKRILLLQISQCFLLFVAPPLFFRATSFPIRGLLPFIAVFPSTPRRRGKVLLREKHPLSLSLSLTVGSFE